MPNGKKGMSLPFTTKSERITPGLKYDREWLLRGPNGEVLTQKKVPRLCHIHTFVNLQQERLHVVSQFCKDALQVSLQKDLSSNHLEEMDVYRKSYRVHTYDSDVNNWFTEAISLPCTFVRCSSSKCRTSVNKANKGLCRDVQSQLNFANEAQLLLISEESVNDLNERLRRNAHEDLTESVQKLFVDAMRFRPNLVISGAEAYAEDCWDTVHVGNAQFTSLGGCNRCQMINIDRDTGMAHKSKEPLATLASYRRVQGKILFGILLRYDMAIPEGEEESSCEEQWLQVGQRVIPSITGSESPQL